MTLPKKPIHARPTNEKLASSNNWADLDAATMRGWLVEYGEVSKAKYKYPNKHTPAIDRVYLVLLNLCSRQRYREKYGDRIINETIEQISLGVISYGSAQDIVQFLEWLGVLVTVREGGKGNATIRQLLKPDYALRTINPVIKEQRETTKRNGIKALDNGNMGSKKRGQSRNSKRPQRHTSTTPAPSVAAFVEETNSLDTYDYDKSQARSSQVMAELRAKGIQRPKRTG
jgi:hypothetical protein